MKKILMIIALLAVTVSAQTYKAVYIVNQRDTTTHNSNVDSIRYDMVNDPQHQLPGTWQVDLLSKDSVESRSAAFWNNYNLIITWGLEEGSGGEGAAGDTTDYDQFLDGVFDTIHKPIITRSAWIANGNPMRLGTAGRATTSPCFRVKSTTHFIMRKTYTDNYNYGDSVRLYSGVEVQAHVLRGMANSVQTLVRWDGERRSDDADSALVAILDSGATNVSGTAAPHRRAYFGLNASWRYCSWAARDLWYRTLRWAIADTTIDTCVTQVMLSREAIDANFLEYSGSVCQTTWHYGGFTSGLLSGWEVRDRATIIRARTSAITTQLPDTSATLAYDIVDAKLACKIQGIAESAPATTFSCWEGLFEILYANQALWWDAKVSYQLDSTCGSWVSSEPDTLMNSLYFQYPDIPWNSHQGSTRGTDYSMVAFDSIWLIDPIVAQWLIWGNLASYIQEARLDSLDNQGLITHTIGTVTGDGEITLSTESGTANLARVRESPLFTITLNWRAANSGAEDLDSTMAFNPDSIAFEAFVNSLDLPANQPVQLYNSGSSATFTCGSFTVRPTASWFSYYSLGSATPYYIIGSADQTSLSAGYYSTWFVPTCSDVTNDSFKVIFNVLPEPGRPAEGTLKFR